VLDQPRKTPEGKLLPWKGPRKIVSRIVEDKGFPGFWKGEDTHIKNGIYVAGFHQAVMLGF